MRAAFLGAKVFRGGAFREEPLFVNGSLVTGDGAGLPPVMLDGLTIFPGFADVHVHLREPGFSYKETIRSGTLAAARGGYTVLGAMPNLQPVPDSRETLETELAAIRRDAAVRVLPYGSITKGEQGKELSDMEAMAPDVLGFSDDGKGVADDDLLRAAMRKAKSLGKIIAEHCEVKALVPKGGCINDCAYARKHGLTGIGAESEWREIERDLRLAKETGCAFHVCHVSTRQSVELIRRAKADGVDVTCETAPHYLILNDGMLRDDGRFKMNPPIRGEEDRQALLEGLRDGTVDCIATDHAPHAAAEKAGGLQKSLMGVSGLEAAFPVLYTELVLRGEITLERLTELLCIAPRRRFGLPGGLEPGDSADFCAVDLRAAYALDSGQFLSGGKSTPFDGMQVRGKIMFTAVKGEPVWQEN